MDRQQSPPSATPQTGTREKCICFHRPRGFPLESIKAATLTSFRSEVSRPLIQQGLANNDPDVDAIYRLTLPLGVSFDINAFPVVLPEQAYCPYNRYVARFIV